MSARSLTKRAKFTFAMSMSVFWKIILIYSIFTSQSDTVLIAIIGAAGVVESAFLGVQGWHDRTVISVKGEDK